MNCAFTICTYSYAGLANVLKNSFLNYHKNFVFYIIYVDIEEKKSEEALSGKNILSGYMSEFDIVAMQFKYDVTEYSTSIKPFAFKYFFDNGYNKVLYFDPDIKFYSRFEDVFDKQFDAYVTPHKLIVASTNEIDSETSMLKYGLYNCGFIGFNKSSLAESFILFWCERLKNYSFDDAENGVYTDQKWVDFITLKMPQKVKIIENFGCNYAPWNMDERKIQKKDNYYVISNDNANRISKLIFAHFSGFNYSLLQDGIIKHVSRKFELYNDLENLLIDYGVSLRSAQANYFMKIPYKYNTYSNGDYITKLNRRLFRELSADNEVFNNPFDENGKFYTLMVKNKLIGKEKRDVRVFNIKNIDKKKKAIYFLLKIFKTVLGVDKYTELLRGLHTYTTYERQIFLIKK